jgi:GAF domain-containing protein
MTDHAAPTPEPGDDHTAGRGDPDQDRMSPALLRALAAHPEQMADLIHALHRRVHDEESLLDLMGRASREAVRLITDTHWAGVTAQFAGTPFTAAHTDDRVLIVDEGQYGQGDGPCLTAMRLDQQVAMTIDEFRGRWPQLAHAADTAGVKAFLAEPLHARDRAVGSLNLYSARPQGLRPDPDVLTVLTDYLDRGLTDYSATQPGEDRALYLQQTLRNRSLIDHATGILMATHDLTPAQATDLLNLQAQRLDIPVHQAAADLINHHTGPNDNRPPPG